MNLVLIGYRGTGKTEVGRRLAERLDMRYMGLDERIVQTVGKPVPEFVAECGWDRFRDVESEVVVRAAEEDRCIVDTGGGAILRPANVENLRRNGRIFWLQATADDIVKRIGGDDQRPSLTGTKSFTAEVEDVLLERTPKYRAAADAMIDTSVLEISEAVDEIVRRFNAYLAGRGL